MNKASPIVIRKSPIAWMGDNFAIDQDFENIADAHKYAKQNFKTSTYLFCKGDNELLATVWYDGTLEFAYAGSLAWHIQELIQEIEELRNSK